MEFLIEGELIYNLFCSILLQEIIQVLDFEVMLIITAAFPVIMHFGQVVLSSVNKKGKTLYLMFMYL